MLLFFSLFFFYAWDMPKYAVLMVATTVFGYATGLAIGALRKNNKEKYTKAVLVASVIVNLGALGFFKYTDFLISTVNGIFGTAVPLLGLALPIGISFYTFQTMSYTIDVYRNDCKVQRSFVDFAAYVTMFPQLIAGPIVRYETVEKQLDFRRESFESFGYGAQRFVLGLAKKVLLANSVGALYSELAAVESPSALTAWLAAITFTFQIYFDFSGYSDMAIGLGKMFGFTFLENFNLPYCADSITDFWRRWHISLSTWFKEYVYIPLGGNRRGKARQIFNLAVTWLLTGIWHGASWNYVMWGAYFALLLIIEKLFLLKALNKLPSVFKHIYALFFIVIGWVIFSNESTAVMGKMFRSMFSFNNFADKFSVYTLFANFVLLALCVIFSCKLPKRAATALSERVSSRTYFIIKTITVIVLFAVSICFMVGESYNPFLYFRF